MDSRFTSSASMLEESRRRQTESDRSRARRLEEEAVLDRKSLVSLKREELDLLRHDTENAKKESRFAKIVSVASILIAFLSLLFSILFGFRILP